MKLVRVIVFLGIMFLIPAMGSAFQIEVQNDSDQDYCYNLWWIDHDLDAEEPAMIAGGELISGERDDFAFNYAAGLYYVIWFDKMSNKVIKTTIQVKKSVDKIILTPKIDGLARLTRS